MTKVTQLNSILVVTVLIISLFFSNYFLPSEDAAILFRYSENLSSTGSISYNLNGIRSEGATDFMDVNTIFFKKWDLKFILYQFFKLIIVNYIEQFASKTFPIRKKIYYNFYFSSLTIGFFGHQCLVFLLYL